MCVCMSLIAKAGFGELRILRNRIGKADGSLGGDVLLLIIF